MAINLNYEPLVIRVDDLDSQEQQVTLNGITFFVRFTHSTAYTNDNWVMDVLDSNKNNLLVGKRITSTTNLSYLSTQLTELLNGYLFCVNTRGLRISMDRENFGTNLNFQIWYVSNEEIENASS